MMFSLVLKYGDMDFGESNSRPGVWEDPPRQSVDLVEPKSVGLKRGPALTFTDQGPKIIPKKPQSSPRMNQPEKQKETNSNPPSPPWQTNFASDSSESFGPANKIGNDFRYVPRPLHRIHFKFDIPLNMSRLYPIGF